jgi:hypothetical protein
MAGQLRNLHIPFANSPASSIQSPVSVSPNPYFGHKRPLRTYLLDGEFEKPWAKDKRAHRPRRGNYIIWGFVGLALALSACYNYVVASKVPRHEVSTSLLSMQAMDSP